MIVIHRKYLVSVGSEGNAVFGSLLRDIRKINNLEPKELAELAGVHASFVRGIERGAQAPSMETAVRLFSPMVVNHGIEWCKGNSDLLVTDPTDGKIYAFDFKAEIKGQNRRTTNHVPKGFWLVYWLHEGIVVAVIVFTDELEALRYAVNNDYKVAFIPFGVNIAETIKEEGVG